MFDGIKIQNVSVEVDALLTNDGLTFAALVDGQTGVILDPTRRAFDRGLTFRLVPRRSGNNYRVEVKGSLHKFHNGGQHNADQFTAEDLLLTLDQLVNEYGFNLFTSTINCIEFGVNVVLPFPVSHVLKNLISYKNYQFALDTRSETPYYVCLLQQYAVKAYDKGKQKGLNCHLLRFEIRVRRMEYFKGTGVQLHTLADLTNVANYEPLGALLIDTFNEILFDDPAINPANLTTREREIYQNGSNPRYWQIPIGLTPQQANTHRQQLSRTKRRYRALLDQYGCKRQQEVSALIAQTWMDLTAVDTNLLTRIDVHRANWHSLSLGGSQAETPGATCHKLTGSILFTNEKVPEHLTDAISHELTDSSAPNLSQNNPLYSGVLCDTPIPEENTTESDTPPKMLGVLVCPVTGVVIEQPRPGQKFVTATMLRNDDDLMLTVERRQRSYGKGSKEDQYSRAAHNIRNQYHNPRNNLLRRIERLTRPTDQLTLFDPSEMFRLTPHEQRLLERH